MTEIKQFKKLPNHKFLHIHPEQFKLWVSDVMNEPHMQFASPADVAERIEQKFGGVKSSHLQRIYRMRLNVSDFRNPEN